MAKGKAKSTLLGIQGVVGHSDAPDWSFLYDVSTILNPNYNLGDRVVTPDGRVFRYAKAADTLYPGKGCSSYATYAISASSAAAQVAGDKSITFASQTVDKDALRGGYLVIYLSATNILQRGIIGNTAGAGTTITVYLDAALTVDIAAATFCEALGNLYGNVLGASTHGEYTSIVGVPTMPATIGQYVWVQTWGVLWLAGTTGIGANTTYERQLVFVGGGAVESHYAHVGDSAQNAGFIIQLDSGGAGPPFIMLQISS